MANKRIDQLPASPGFDTTDLIEKERDPAGLKAHENTSLGDLVSWILPQVNYSTFPTLAALRANISYVDEKVYCTLGELAKGDGNARLYYFDATSVAVDNGGSVVRPDNILAVNPGRYLQFTF